MLGVALLLVITDVVHAQGVVFRQEDFLNTSYEDASDFLRKFPGMYPMDYGTLGAPIVFHPWNLHPWQIRVERDGIPQNRISDGIYESNLQPVSELDSMNYYFLSGVAAGRVLMKTRAIPVDTPVTEFQIREGYYGYGTVDFSHGQRVYRRSSIEVTGRLAWYNGLRERTASRVNRVRGRFGFNVSNRWRANLTYAGSHIDSEFPLTTVDPYLEREEGIAEISERDSARSSLSPSIQIFARRDREDWGDAFRMKETVTGWNIECRAERPNHSFRFRQLTMLANLSYPQAKLGHEIFAEVSAEDSVRFPLGDIAFRGSMHQASRTADRIRPLYDAGIAIRTLDYKSVSLHGGLHYLESTPPILWLNGSYPLSARPLLVDSTFADINRYYGTASPTATSRGVDRFLKSDFGVRWQRNRAFFDVAIHSIDPLGDFQNQFVAADTLTSLVYVRDVSRESQLGLSGMSVLPLIYELRLDSWWFAQLNPASLNEKVDTRGYTRLYFEKAFFKSPLTVRSHISYEYIGQRLTFSDKGTATLGPSYLVGFRISASIRGVTLVWGTENFFKESYDILPGYRMIGKEEYLAFMWKLWL
jgi:hypothetical protein